LERKGWHWVTSDITQRITSASETKSYSAITLLVITADRKRTQSIISSLLAKAAQMKRLIWLRLASNVTQVSAIVWPLPFLRALGNPRPPLGRFSLKMARLSTIWLDRTKYDWINWDSPS
jgi:hypothetical protein